jgi:hypothetical protein
MTSDSFYRRFQRGVLHASSVRLEAARFNSYAWLLDRLVGFKDPLYRYAARRDRAAMSGESPAAGFSPGKSTDASITGAPSPNRENSALESTMNDMTGWRPWRYSHDDRKAYQGAGSSPRTRCRRFHIQCRIDFGNTFRPNRINASSTGRG